MVRRLNYIVITLFFGLASVAEAQEASKSAPQDLHGGDLAPPAPPSVQAPAPEQAAPEAARPSPFP
jgi:hypothetical protein